jgi:hypothetical protein
LVLRGGIPMFPATQLQSRYPNSAPERQVPAEWRAKLGSIKGLSRRRHARRDRAGTLRGVGPMAGRARR